MNARRRQSETPVITDAIKAKICSLYVAHGLSAAAVGERFGISHTKIGEILGECGIAVRNPRKRKIKPEVTSKGASNEDTRT